MVFSATYLLLWIIAVFQGLAICALARQLHSLSRASGDKDTESLLSIGTRAPEFQALDLRTGQQMGSSAFFGKRTVLLFLSTDCGMCKKVAAELEGKTLGGSTRLAIYCDGARRACTQRIDRLDDSIAVMSRDLADVPNVFRMPNLPSAVIIDPSWRIERYLHGPELQRKQWFEQVLEVPTASAHSETLRTDVIVTQAAAES